MTAMLVMAAGSNGSTAGAATRFVAQQHGAADGCPPCECPFGRIVDRLLLVGDDELVGAHPVDHRQHVEHEAVDLFLVDLAGLHGLDELRAVHPHRRGHLDVQPGIGRLGRVVDAEPVGHDEAVEAPLVAEDVGEQATVLGAVFGAEAVVGAHDPPGAALLDRALERAEVDLAQRPVVDLYVDRHAVHLGVVADEVFDRDGDVLRLDAAHVRRGEDARQLGILAVALERATADGGAVDVHSRAEQDVGALAARFGAEQFADPVRSAGSHDAPA